MHDWCRHVLAIYFQSLLGFRAFPPLLLDLGAHPIDSQVEILNLVHTTQVHALLSEQILSNGAPCRCVHRGPLDFLGTRINLADKFLETSVGNDLHVSEETILDTLAILDVGATPTDWLCRQDFLETPWYEDSVCIQLDDPVELFPCPLVRDFCPHLLEHSCVDPSLAFLPLDQVELIQGVVHLDSVIALANVDIRIRKNIVSRAGENTHPLVVLLSPH